MFCTFVFILSKCLPLCVLVEKAKAFRFHIQSGSISSGRPPSRGRLPTVGTSRDDCPRWGDCTCALMYYTCGSHTEHTHWHRQIWINHIQTCMRASTLIYQTAHTDATHDKHWYTFRVVCADACRFALLWLIGIQHSLASSFKRNHYDYMFNLNLTSTLKSHLNPQIVHKNSNWIFTVLAGQVCTRTQTHTDTKQREPRQIWHFHRGNNGCIASTLRHIFA